MRSGHRQYEQKVFIGAGSNLKDRHQCLQKAFHCLREEGVVHSLQSSTVYRTSPWGVKDQPEFLNAVFGGETQRTPPELLSYLQDLERRLGRRPPQQRQRWGPRLIDLDILLYGHTEWQEPGLQIPHPRMEDRAFVLVPLAELIPDYRLPGGATVKERAGTVMQCDSCQKIEPAGALLRL